MPWLNIRQWLLFGTQSILKPFMLYNLLMCETNVVSISATATSVVLFSIMQFVTCSNLNPVHILWIMAIFTLCGLCSILELIAAHGFRIVRFNALCLEILDNFSTNMLKYLIYIIAGFCTCFEETQSMLFGKCLTTSWINLLFTLWHVCFVSNQYLAYVWQSMLVYLIQPILNVIESCFFGAIVYQ